MLSFLGRHYPDFIILQCVRWYVSYALSYRNIEEMMKERGFDIDHATINRWVLHYAPLLERNPVNTNGLFTVVGGWMKPILRSKANGGICIVPSINMVQQLSSW